jgi:1,2-phenylacetyl-CoA epoxidase PaaB subunit
MSSYRVFFVNEVPQGERLFRCCQRMILVRSARSRERAIEAAKKRFMRLEHVRDWHIRAAAIEVEAIPPDESASTADLEPCHGEGAPTSQEPGG